ncbi:MAG TPA: hypothetical protein VLI04_04825 [Nocardioidaceae bacterium]|nr:hypothetical protein [Nocardioidaceae bacterium]
METQQIAEPVQTRSSARWLVPAAAFAVIGVIGATAALLNADGSGRGSGPLPAVDVLVPWAPLDPNHPEITEVIQPARPDPAVAAAAPTCGPTDVWTSGQVGAAAGTQVLTLHFHGSSVPCRLEGSPAIELFNDGQRLDVEWLPRIGSGEYDDPVLVSPDGGGLGALELYWSSEWCTDPIRNDEVRIRVGDGWVPANGFRDSPGCNGEPGSGPNVVRVGTFRPSENKPETVGSAYSGVDARLKLVGDRSAAEPLRFVVTLVATAEDVLLDPCPDYEIVQGHAVGAPTLMRFALNCDRVPYDDIGTPYLPVGVPVRFAMEPPWTAGGEKSTWRLIAPGGPVLGLPPQD